MKPNHRPSVFLNCSVCLLALAGWVQTAVCSDYDVRRHTVYPPVNTLGIDFANGVEIRGGRVLLVQNGGHFVKNGRVLMNQAQMVASVARAPRTSRAVPVRHYTARRPAPSFLARIPAEPRAGNVPTLRRGLAAIFGKSRREDSVG